MKRLSFALVVFACASAAFGATRPSATSSQPTAQRVSRTSASAPGTPVSVSTPNTRAVTSRSATAQTTPQVSRSARAAVSQPTTVGRAAKQSVISTGTKVATATENTAVDQVCWAKFSGCMDSFCMLDNASGGRCICSDKNAEYDAILEEIQKLDEQSYQLATVGVERIEMGDAVDAVMSKTDSVTKRVTADAAKSKRQSLDLSSWNSLDLDFDADAEDIFDFSSDGVSISNKTGDALYRAAAKLCNAQITECKSQSTLMELMYKQRVRSDCTAYENSLRQARTQSAQKLYAAQSAMREAALEQYRNANKYDLGQCTVQFKQCMQTTGGCGDDFTGCVDLAARANSTAKKTEGKVAKQKTIKGTSSKIQISAETYDTLEAKKALCMTVTQECVNVRDQVWDAFLREAAPQIKSAELIVESNLRTSCISNISNCFQKACRDTMDPNDPEGSYDMCLTRPDTLRSVCKVEIDPCESAEPQIMEYVRARLKSMRVDSCTNEFKACLQSEDRCGEDYTQCIGLDTDTIVHMCPAEKLTGCTYEYSGEDKKVKTDSEIYTELATIAQGIFLSIDNNMLTACQKAVKNKVIEVCGDLSYCDAFDEDTVIGTDSLTSYVNSAGDTVIDGLMNFGVLNVKQNTNGTISIDKGPYSNWFDNKGNVRPSVSDSTEQRIAASINTVSNKIQQKLNVIDADQTIDMCINGRSASWRGGDPNTTSLNSNRFPHLLDSYRLMIFNSGLDRAYTNYRTKYDELVSKAIEKQDDDVKSLLCAALSADEDASASLSAAMDNIYQDAQNTTYGIDNYTYTIRGADLKSRLSAVSNTGNEYILTDGTDDGNMVGTVSVTSIYSPGTNICTLKTIVTMCESMREKMTLDTDTTTNDTNIDIFVAPFADAENNYKRVKKKEYNGIFCDKFMTPSTKTDEIKM